MTTKVTVEMPLCGYRTKIRAERDGDGVRLRIFSGCKKIQYVARELEALSMEELADPSRSKLFKLLLESRFTPTCLVPVGIMNAAWVEVGNTSRYLALEKKELKIRFEE